MRMLTPKQEAFAQHFAMSHDATAAYRASYNTANAKPNTVHRMGFGMLANPKVAARIAELQARIKASAEEKFDITADKVLCELAKIGFANIQDYVRVDPDTGIPHPNFEPVTRAQFAAIGEITFEDIVTGERTGTRVKFKLLDKRGALVDLGKHLGLFRDKVDVKHTHEWIDAAASVFDAELARLVDRRRDTIALTSH